MIVLVLNCGSSSLKFQLIAIDRRATDRDRRLARGTIERIGGQATVDFDAEGRSTCRETAYVPDHPAGVRRVIDWLRAMPSLPGGGASFDAIGHRVVHGGERFSRPVLVDPAVVTELEALEKLAPLHNAPSLAGIRACRDLLGPTMPMVAVFDTTFHATLPEGAYRYAIPYELSVKHHIRRYGFHGTSYRSVLARYCEITGTPVGQVTMVALHLGNGCSAAAIRNGRSVDTSMGFTPLEGLVMGTRAGDLDPAIIGHLARQEEVPEEEVERWLNERSGLLGLSGRSRDMRDLLEHEASDARARLAVEVFCHRARKYVGAYLAVLGGAGAVVFTGGIGENSPEVRARICADMEWCGLAIDAGRNRKTVGEEGLISPDGVRVRAFVIPTDEERLIAQDTADCIEKADREDKE